MPVAVPRRRFRGCSRVTDRMASSPADPVDSDEDAMTSRSRSKLPVGIQTFRVIRDESLLRYPVRNGRGVQPGDEERRGV